MFWEQRKGTTLQLLAKASLNVEAVKENYNFLKPFKDSVGLIALVFTIWLSDVEFSWKKKIINCFTELTQT